LERIIVFSAIVFCFSFPQFLWEEGELLYINSVSYLN